MTSKVELKTEPNGQNLPLVGRSRMSLLPV